MRSGRLDRRIIIQQFSPASPAINADGEPSGSWTTLDAVWAEILPLKGTEKMQGQQELAQAEYKFNIRYRGDITPKNRISYSGNIYDILAVLSIGRNKGLSLQCRRNVA